MATQSGRHWRHVRTAGPLGISRIACRRAMNLRQFRARVCMSDLRPGVSTPRHPGPRRRSVLTPGSPLAPPFQPAGRGHAWGPLPGHSGGTVPESHRLPSPTAAITAHTITRAHRPCAVPPLRGRSCDRDPGGRKRRSRTASRHRQLARRGYTVNRSLIVNILPWRARRRHIAFGVHARSPGVMHCGMPQPLRRWSGWVRHRRVSAVRPQRPPLQLLSTTPCARSRPKPSEPPATPG